MHFSGGQAIAQGLWGVLFILALFACVVLHEFGHALTARRFGIATRDITLYPIGGIASLDKMPDKPAQELLVAIAGPVVNMIIAVVLWISMNISGQTPTMSRLENSNDISQIPLLWGLFFANVMLAVFNLIPAFPMDGGRILRALLAFLMDRTKATRIAAGIGQFLAMIFVFLGFFYNFWLVFIGLFIFIGAGSEAAFEKTRSALAGLTVKDALMKRFTILSPDDNLGRAVDALLNSQETEFVVAEDRVPIGLLGKNEIIRGLTDRGKEALVTELMNRDFIVVGSDTKLEDFLQQVLRSDQGIAVVMNGSALEGLIDRENIRETLLINEALQRKEG